MNGIDTSRMDAHLRSLEDTLDQAIEHVRIAKQAAKRAKEEAKQAKKARKRARKALIEAQKEYAIQQSAESQALVEDADATPEGSIGQRVAESPERRRSPRRKRSSRVRTKTPAANPSDRTAYPQRAAHEQDSSTQPEESGAGDTSKVS